MEYKKIRNFSFPVIGQGVGEYKWKKSHLSLLQKGIDLGMTLLDTAECYDSGNSEKLVGSLAEKNDNIIISTKFSPENASNIFNSFFFSAERLGCYPTIYHMHWPNPTASIDYTLKCLFYLKKQEKISFVGLDNVSLHLLTGANLYYSVDVVQAEYNLFDRTQEDEIIPFCQKNDILFMAYSPLDQGRSITDKKALKLLTKICNKYNKDIFQLSLKWLIKMPNVIVIPKSTKEQHIINNADIFDFDLTQEEYEEIGQITKREVAFIKPSKIKVVQDGQNNKFAYSTLLEAVENKHNFVPSPLDLSTTIDNKIKPVRVWYNGSEYELLEGRVRYWAWVIAKKDEPIPCLIRESKN